MCVAIVIKKKRIPRFVIQFRKLEILLTSAEKNWQVLLEIQNAKKVKGNYLEHSNLLCATNLLCLL